MAVSAVLIATVGYMIFEKNLVGQLSDWLVAFLWGFSADVSVAQLRKIFGLP